MYKYCMINKVNKISHMLRNTHSPHASTYALYQTTHGTTRCGRPRLNYMDYVERLTGMKTNELVEVSQDREAWRELVVARVDLQLPDQRERERLRLSIISIFLYLTVCVNALLSVMMF